MLTEPYLYKNFKVEGLTQEIQDAFEKYLEYHALKLLQNNRKKAGSDYLDLLNLHFRNCEAHKYALGGNECDQMLDIPDHFCELLWYCFSKHQECTKDQVLKFWNEDMEGIADLWVQLTTSKKNS